MKILSLFDGMSCGYLAMLKAEVSIDRYVAYEIDKYAIKTSKHNFPDIKHRGDVFDADFTEFEGFDFLVGGSPCTYWSIAQSPDKREATASGMGWELFSQYVRALNEAKPKYFIYENNKSMSKEIKQSISDTFGFEPIMIDSALVSAQSRSRLYWVGKQNADGSYSKVNVELPEDREILLKDILDGAVAMNTKSNGKSQTLKAQYSHTNVTNICCYNSTFGASGAAVCIAQRGRYKDDSNETEQHFEVRGQKKNTLTTVQKDNLIAEPLRVGTMPMSDGSIKQNRQWRIYSDKAKSITLMSNGGGGGAKTGLYAIYANTGNKRPVYYVKDGQITIKGKTYPIRLPDGFYIIRKLTVTECMRLQTVPEWYQFPVSDTQAYKMLGNGWTVEVIVHLIKSALTGNVEPEQIKLF